MTFSFHSAHYLQAVVSSISTPSPSAPSLPPAQILAWLYNCPLGTQVISRWISCRHLTSSADVKLESLSFSPNWFFHRSLGDILNSFLLLTSLTIQLVSALGWFHLILYYCLESIFTSMDSATIYWCQYCSQHCACMSSLNYLNNLIEIGEDRGIEKSFAQGHTANK